MEKNILVINDDGIPSELKNTLVHNGFTLHFARGPLTLKNKLTTKKIQAVIWLDSVNFKKLFIDICNVLNKFKLPVYILGISSSKNGDSMKYLKCDYYYLSDIKEFLDSDSINSSNVSLDDLDQNTKLKNLEINNNELSFRYVLRSTNKQKKLNFDEINTNKYLDGYELSVIERDSLKTGVEVKHRHSIWQKIFKK